MIYVERDKDGNIIAIHKNPDSKAMEPRHLMDAEVLEFLDKSGDLATHLDSLSSSDIGMIRVIEDLIDILIKKNIILFTDLPHQAQEKILSRKNVRDQLGDVCIMVDDDKIL